MRNLLFLFLACPLISISQNYSYKNLVLEDGGIRGLAYPGAVKVEEKGIITNIEKVGALQQERLQPL